jgi:hypothetical protein
MILPPQKLSMAEKLQRDEVTGKNNIEETIDYYISQCSWNTINTEIAELYAAVEGILNPDRYKYVQNPFNVKIDSDNNISGARLRNFNILKGIANLLTGEFSRRSHEYTTFHFNPTAEISYEDALNLVIQDYYKQLITNTFIEFGIIDNEEPKDMPTLEQYVEKFKTTYKDNRIITGQDAIDYIKFNCELDNKFIDLYWEWIITGRVYTFKTVRHNDVHWEAVPSNELFVPINRKSRFVEDAEFAVRRQIVEPFQLTDMFKGIITEEIIDSLEETILRGYQLNFTDVTFTGNNGVFRMPSSTNLVNRLNSQLLNMSSTGVELFHVQYRTWRKYGELTYLDPVAGIVQIEVDDTYVLDKANGDIEINWLYESQIMSGYRVFDFYLQVEPLDWNRGEVDSDIHQKLEYNGIVERSYTGTVQSIIKQGMDYQELVNIVHYQTEKLINKNKDKLLVMPYGLINKKKGMTAQSTMYHADSTSILWVDETAPNAQLAGQMIKSVDMSLGNFIQSSYQLIREIKNAYWEEIGMNPQRYADVGERAGKATTEQAIIRSATITNELVRQFDWLIGKDYAGLLDLSKWAWINGTKGKYIKSDGTVAYLELNADNAMLHTETSYGIFIKDATENTEAVNYMRQQGMNLIQNGAPLDSISKLWSTKNVGKLDNLLSKMQKHKEDFEMLLQQQAQEANAELQESINANDLANREAEKYKVDLQSATDIKVAEIRANASNNQAIPNNGLDNTLDIEKLQHQKEMDERNMKDKEINTKLKNKKIEIDKNKINNQKVKK